MSFPETVWRAAVLRGLDARARAELERAARLREAAAGEGIFRAGDVADTVFIVVSGAVDVRALRRGDREVGTLRTATSGEAFGEEATLDVGGVRRWDAVAAARAVVVEIPVLVLQRAAGRAGIGDAWSRIERTLRRAATVDLLGTVSFARDLGTSDLDVLVDATEHIDLARGQALFRVGDSPTHVYFVADGMVQVQTEDDARLHVRAYLARGDVVGDAEAAQNGAYDVAVVASGKSRLLAVKREVFADISARNPGLRERVERIAATAADAQAAVAVAGRTTQNVFQDLYRLKVARSLLVIDQDACVRCGHCAWSCADAHDDGIARLVRRGDKVVTAVVRARAADAREPPAEAPLLLPNSCQHCENPACMVDCPTGAIGRDPRGEVFIRADICIGCGNCAKGCPWDNIAMAPRAGLPVGLSPEIAVKCDLCRDRDHGPACVSACPTEALARIHPQDALPDVRAALRAEAPADVLPPRTAAWPWVTGAALVAVSLASRTAPGAPYATGAVAAACVTTLAAYAVVKRRTRLRVRPWFIAHVALGLVGMGAVVAHAGARVPANLAGALHVVFWLTALAGVWGAVAYRIVPAALTRLERGGALPEDLAPRRLELEERVYTSLSGRSDVVKALFARVLLPYMRSPATPALLLARGATLRGEGARLHAQVDALLDGRKSERLGGLDDLVRLVVELAALPAQRAAQIALRAFLPAHVVLTVVVVVLLALHVTFELVYR